MIPCTFQWICCLTWFLNLTVWPCAASHLLGTNSGTSQAPRRGITLTIELYFTVCTIQSFHWSKASASFNLWQLNLQALTKILLNYICLAYKNCIGKFVFKLQNIFRMVLILQQLTIYCCKRKQRYKYTSKDDSFQNYWAASSARTALIISSAKLQRHYELMICGPALPSGPHASDS